MYDETLLRHRADRGDFKTFGLKASAATQLRTAASLAYPLAHDQPFSPGGQ
jgi:hypothetical protein